MSFESIAEPIERLRAGLDAYLAYVERQGAAYAAIFRGGIGSDAEVMTIIDETRSRFLDRLLSETFVERPSAILRSALRGWIGFVEAASLDWVERREVERGALREFLVALFAHVLLLAQSHGGSRVARRVKAASVVASRRSAARTPRCSYRPRRSAQHSAGSPRAMNMPLGADARTRTLACIRVRPSASERGGARRSAAERGRAPAAERPAPRGLLPPRAAQRHDAPRDRPG